MNSPIFYILLLLLSILNLCLHSIGITLLLTLYKTQQKTAQKLFMINLSVVECVWNVISCAREVLYLVYWPDYEHWPITFTLAGGVNYLDILSMFYITGDRLVHSVLLMRYRQYWNLYRTKILIVFTWIICGIVSLYVSLHYRFKTRHAASVYDDVFLLICINMVLFCLYLIFSIVTYVTLFLKYYNSKLRLARFNNNEDGNSLIQTFRKSRFFITALLVGNYLLLTVLPTLVEYVWYMTYYDVLHLHIVIGVSVFGSRLSKTLEAFVYIFLQTSVRNLLTQKIKDIYNRKNESSM